MSDGINSLSNSKWRCHFLRLNIEDNLSMERLRWT